jgi:hypothetical protein
MGTVLVYVAEIVTVSTLLVRIFRPRNLPLAIYV